MYKVLNEFNKALTLSTGELFTFQTAADAIAHARKYEPYLFAFRVVNIEVPAEKSGKWFA